MLAQAARALSALDVVLGNEKGGSGKSTAKALFVDIVFAFLSFESSAIASPSASVDHIVLRFDPRASTSIRENYLHVLILESLLRQGAGRSNGTRQCQIRKDLQFQF